MPHETERAFWTAGPWLLEHYAAACNDALEDGFFSGLPPVVRAGVDEAPENVRRFVEVNALEWLLADGQLALGRGKRARKVAAAALVLGPDGPPLEPEHRERIVAMAAEPLRLYEVTQVSVDKCLTLRRLLAPAEPARHVIEPDVAHGAEVGDVLGARLLPLDGGQWETSPALYPLSESLRSLVVADQALIADREAHAAVTAWLIDVLSNERMVKEILRSRLVE